MSELIAKKNAAAVAAAKSSISAVDVPSPGINAFQTGHSSAMDDFHIGSNSIPLTALTDVNFTTPKRQVRK